MTPRSSSAPIEVLLVEDNRDDADLTIRALQKAKIHKRVTLATDGDQALAHLRGEGGVPTPDLILLDLDLPKRDGRAVLEEIKRDEQLRHIPVIVVSGSGSMEDVVQSYRQHANAFVRKPVDPGAFLEVVNSIERFWLEIVRLP